MMEWKEAGDEELFKVASVMSRIYLVKANRFREEMQRCIRRVVFLDFEFEEREDELVELVGEVGVV